MYDGTNIQYGKRKEIIGKNDQFFDYQRICSDVEPKVKKIYSELKCQKIYVYGELFGGGYKHDDVPKVKDVQLIQTGVYYSPKIEFYAFDIMTENREKIYLDYEEALKIFKKVELFHAEPLFIGKYEECLSYNVKFESTIPKKLGYPPIKGNIAEGIVIKPLKTIYVEGKKTKERAILKLKPKEFKEDKRFHEAEKWEEKQKSTDPSNYEMLNFEALPLITTQRIDNCISKIGMITKQNYEKLEQSLIDDVLQKIQEDFEKDYQNLSKEEKESLYLFIEKESKDLIQQYIKI